MSAQLLAITVGPVQEFIAAARRTRDLWFGSHVLSEISKAVARAVRDEGGGLIFPAPERPEHLEPDNLNDPTKARLDVANVILAEIPDGKEANTIAGAAREAARDRWRAFAGRVIADPDIAAVVRCDPTSDQGNLWAEQVDDVVEFYAAWVPLPGREAYPDARERVMRLLAGRKNCRDFEPAGKHPGLPKSSLDGLRDTVLRGPGKNDDARTYRNSWPRKTRRKLRVRTGEQLDVVGVVKRAWAPKDQPLRYPSVSRVAADPWVRGIAKTGGQAVLAAYRRVCAALPTEAVHRLDAGFEQYKDFPYEGTTLFRTRHHEWWEETEGDSERPSDRRAPPPWYADARVDETLAAVERFAAAHHLGEEPNPYLAVIVADGDNMGKTIAALASPDEHRTFSRGLSQFAGEARKIVREHQGVPVYAGGDDVFAFVPSDRCLDCARQLHDKFGDLMRDLVEDLNKRRDVPLAADMVLSVGVAIGHFLENLEDLRAYGQAAEKHAKKPDKDGVKDGLAVHLHKRGGGPMAVRARWGPKPTPENWLDAPDTRLTGFAVRIVNRQLPGRLANDLHDIADVYDEWPAGTVAAAIRKDALRVVAAKEAAGGRAGLDEVGKILTERVKDAATLRQLADELLIARQIAVACRQAGEGRR